VRDGPTDAVAVDQTLFLRGGPTVSFGFLFGEENPRSSAGDDWQLRAYQGYVGTSLPLWWQMVADLTFLYRYDNYPQPNSFAGDRKARHDDEYHMSAEVWRPINRSVSVAITYYGTVNDSNIDVFTYDRNIVSGLIRVAY